jgi:hypothetical protein
MNMGRKSDLGERLLRTSESQGISSPLPFPFVREYLCWLRIVDVGEGRLAEEGKEREWDAEASALEKTGANGASGLIRRSAWLLCRLVLENEAESTMIKGERMEKAQKGVSVSSPVVAVGT